MKKIVLMVILIMTLDVTAQQEAGKVIDQFAQRVMAAVPVVPSVSIAVVKGDTPILIKAYGYADPDKKIKAKTSTPYYIASITKSFMGLLASVLDKEGSIDLDAKLTLYKPFKNLKNKNLFEDITIRELLNHTSGISNDFITFRDAYTGDKSKEIMEMLLEEVTEKRENGKKYGYDNLGYNIFDILLKAELGKDWRDLLQEKIFSPMGMERTTAYISKAKKNNWKIAWPYLGLYGTPAVRSYLMKNDNMMQAAGGMLCTGEDAARWISFYLNDGLLDGKQVYPASHIENTLKPTVAYKRKGDIFNDTGYGIGWVSAKLKSEKVNYHFGGYNGFFSHISIMPKKGIGVAAFANENAFGDNVSNLIASFAYDYLLGNVKSIDEYDDEIDALKARVSDLHKSIKQHMDQLETREWQLTEPKSSYTGTFSNKYAGTLEISMKDGEPFVQMGPLQAIATAFTKENTMRIDLAGGGVVVKFEVKDKEVVGLEISGNYFERVK